MIITRLQGGLGNQLFEYTFGRSIALKNDTELTLDLSQYEEDPQRRYMLDAFSIQARVATARDIARLIGGNRLTRKIRGMLGFSRIVHEPHFAFYPPALEVKDPCYLDGHWQSEKYFSDIAPTLRGELVLKKPLSKEAGEIAARMQEGMSISIHVRRGDYVNSQFAALGSDYYERAIKKIRETVRHPKCFIFSDDITWARENLALPDAVFVSNRGILDIEELILMSRCAHHIIANSSFSWWGAWLNQNETKIVIAPKKWFILDVHNTKDLLPPTWIKM